MADAIMSFNMIKPQIHCSSFQTNMNPYPRMLRQSSSVGFSNGQQKVEGSKNKRASLSRMQAVPDFLPLMAVLVEHIEGQRDLITQKSVWHISMKKASRMSIHFTLCLLVGGAASSAPPKDPYYDSEQYRKDGGDGTGHWVYEKQEDMEESARSELWREELIDEIEQKVGGLRELEQATKKEEQLVK